MRERRDERVNRPRGDLRDRPIYLCARPDRRIVRQHQRAHRRGWLMTPTNASLGRLDPARLSKLDRDGRLLSGDPPTKESFLHRVMYEERPATGAVVHLHSTHSVAVSCLAEIDP